MWKRLPAEIPDLGPEKAEYKNNPGQYGFIGSIAVLLMLYAGIQMCRSILNSWSSRGFNSILESPAELICGPIAVAIGIIWFFIWLFRISNRVVVYRDGFVFLSRLRRKVDVWRWEDIEFVELRVEMNRKTKHTFHTYVVHGQEGRLIYLDGLHDVDALGHTIEEEASRVKQQLRI
jgi:hypothetical protein